MLFPIKSAEFHQNARDTIQEDSRQRSLAGNSGAMSSWSAGFELDLHGLALELLENGEEIGIDGPAQRGPVLLDSDGVVVSCEDFTDDYGTYQWRLTAEAAKRFGRRTIPARQAAPTKRCLQGRLGLSEGQAIYPCSWEITSRSNQWTTSRAPTTIDPSGAVVIWRYDLA